MKRVTMTITGNVQGVAFRYFAKEKADDLGITGFAQNQPDGSLRIEAEGEDATLEKFIAWCRKGPSFAQVQSVTITEMPLLHDQMFRIKHV